MTQRGETELVTLDGPHGPRAHDALSAALAFVLATQQKVRWKLHEETAGIWGLAQAVAGATGGRFERTAEEARFFPAPLRPGRLEVRAGDDEPLAPLLEALWWPLALAGGTSSLEIHGVTHAPGVASFHDVVFGTLPLWERAGCGGELSLESAGFAPDGGGFVRASVFAAPRLAGLELPHRGMLREVRAVALVANLGIGIALPMERRLTERLRLRGIAGQVEMLPMPAARGRGLAVAVIAEFERSRAAFTAVGEPGRPGHEVAEQAVDGLVALLERRGAFDAQLATRALVGAALAASPAGAPGAIGSGKARPSSRFTVAEVTPALLQVAQAARALCGVDVKVLGLPGDEGVVEVRPEAAPSA